MKASAATQSEAKWDVGSVQIQLPMPGKEQDIDLLRMSLKTCYMLQLPAAILIFFPLHSTPIQSPSEGRAKALQQQN